MYIYIYIHIYIYIYTSPILFYSDNNSIDMLDCTIKVNLDIPCQS